LIMSRLRISVIVPVFQEAVRIGDLVRYLLLHGGEALVEVIVVDSGSTDCTAAYAAQAGARVLQSPERSRAAQMNAGAGAASGEILYFVHADTMPPATFATDISETLEAGFVMGCYRYQFDKPGILLIINAWFTRFPWLWCQGGDKTFFIRKSTFFDLGGYNGHFVIMEEYDFLRRAMPHYPLCIIPKYATVSARKYERNSWLRVQISNFLVFSLFRLGVAPVKLKRLYGGLLS
jgi:rSAM/selenodomain-associated transferase 2